MNRTLRIEGMHCEHCSASVEKALRAVPGVTDVRIDLAGKTAVVVAADNVADEAQTAAVAAAGFEVVGVQ